MATGGYGRAELCPLSDIDLLVLVPAHTAETKQAVETILYPLWDVGLKVGQSVRTVAEAADYARNDLHLHVALLETRLLCGERSQFAQLEVRLSELLSGEAWQPLAKAIVESQRKRREKAGGSAYLQEPDLKNGVGALRDVKVVFGWPASPAASPDRAASVPRVFYRPPTLPSSSKPGLRCCGCVVSSIFR